MSTSTIDILDFEGLAHASWAEFPYRLTAYKEIPTLDGGACSANIVRGRTKVGFFQNDGRGGCDDYAFVSSAARVEFEAAVGDLFGAEPHQVMDTALGAFLATLYQLTRMSKRCTVLINPLHARHFFWLDGYETLGTPDRARAAQWAQTQNEVWSYFDPDAAAILPL